ncbi:MAG: hypothetical protein KIT48_00720 [Pseudolabrys sp.]|jgi:hypothetical protein|nr:hypothetical protein [Pseudolabrys sp.]
MTNQDQKNPQDQKQQTQGAPNKEGQLGDTNKQGQHNQGNDKPGQAGQQSGGASPQNQK